MGNWFENMEPMNIQEELQCIFEYEQIMEMLLKEEALTRHLTEKSKN